MSVYRELMKHSAVYWVGHVLQRLASILLLPLYTAYLSPADYGNLSQLELTQTILQMLALGGISFAAVRFSTDPDYQTSRHALWTTGLCMLAVISLPQLVAAWLLRDRLATLTFGPEITDGGYYYSLAIYTLGINLFVDYSSTYLRVLKKSGLFVLITISILIMRIALNIWTIAFLRIGILGFLYSGLIAGGCQALICALTLFVGRSFSVMPDLFKKFWSYGWPFIVSSLASTIMHQGDRYLLQWILNDMSQVGIYSLAYSLVQGVYSLICQPFYQIWAPMAFEVDQLPDRQEVFGKVYKYFTLGLFLVLLAVALFSEPIVRLFSNERYLGAANLMPYLCLGFLLFSLHGFFCLPAQIHKQTRKIAMISVVAALVRISVGACLILASGLRGAALSGIATYAVYSLGGHWRYRKIEKLRFSLRLVLGCIGPGVIVVALMESVVPTGTALWKEIALSTAAWCILAAMILLGPARPIITRTSPLRRWLERREVEKEHVRARSDQERYQDMG